MFYLTLDVKKFNANLKKNRNRMFNFQISKEKTGNDENVIHPVNSRKTGGGQKKHSKQRTQNKILEINSNTKIGKMTVNVQEDNLNVNEVIFLVKRQNKYPMMSP